MSEKPIGRAPHHPVPQIFSVSQQRQPSDPLQIIRLRSRPSFNSANPNKATLRPSPTTPPNHAGHPTLNSAGWMHGLGGRGGISGPCPARGSVKVRPDAVSDQVHATFSNESA